MIVVDANVLLYACNPDRAHHEACRDWLEQALNGPEQVGIPRQIVLALIRIATNPRVFTHRLDAAEAARIVDDWFACPQATRAGPADGYPELLKEQLATAQVSGPLVADAALAALALQTSALLCTWTVTSRASKA